MEKTAIIINVAIPADKGIIEKEKEKIEKYHNLKGMIQRLWKLKKIDVWSWGLLRMLQRTLRNTSIRQGLK